MIRYYVCNYGPGGNRVGRKMYQPGRACSACPGSSTCSSSYPGLCASNPFQTRPSVVTRPSNSPILRSNTIPNNNISPVDNALTISTRRQSYNPRSNTIPNFISTGNAAISRPTSTISTRRQPRLTDNRFSARLGEVSHRSQTRNRQTSQDRNTRNRNQRRQTFSPCRNIWCNIARFFQ